MKIERKDKIYLPKQINTGTYMSHPHTYPKTNTHRHRDTHAYTHAHTHTHTHTYIHTDSPMINPVLTSPLMLWSVDISICIGSVCMC